MFYIENANSFPHPLSDEEEEMHLKKMWEGAIEARNILIEKNLRLVAHIAKKYTLSFPNLTDDIISVGTIGLIKAIETYSQEKNTRLSTYAAKCIENEILMYLRQNKKFLSQISLENPIGSDKDGNEITLIDVLQSDQDDIDDQVNVKIQIKNLLRKLDKILKGREKHIIELRYGLKNGKERTQMEVANLLGISRSYVSRIEKKALKKLYNELQKSCKESY
ncbi:RNA polymerase, sigma 28 subunit, FliA/WhiG family [Caldicellulosiruptor saccharolyticus DSM 8903]|uniref:RNA polymerase sigma factor n=1 Tax=Caldicellulosiruptor saccharolyticus (strain ATCC 43494 / DSM 8903 / Tp8T 6331) TaxID=351627 RepID=A4XHX5_CALS8|nr:RNA polymerase sporulation sigma factor SigK [Caldicellulosiruptor saccharolyticus]ABP66510.1 RNA polymerase, sigma 28 subunit, FliA/WhiG family [Caldicellulosiruptor saccharolyticus DSM 8903]